MPRSGKATRRRKTARLLVVWAMAAVVGLALPLALMRGWVPRVSALWPLDLASPGGWLLDTQLAELRADAGLCRAVLAKPHIVAEPITDHAAADGCGWTNSFRIGKAGSIKVGVGVASCELSAGLALWLTHVVQPAALAEFGRMVARLEHLGTYSCRNMRGNPAFSNDKSEHASANAIDVKGFVLTDGRRIGVQAHWRDGSNHGRFLKAVHAGACRYFRVVLGPSYNSAHADHFHLDRGRWRACR